MTPMANRLARELTLPQGRRRFDGEESDIRILTSDIHCFEVSDILEAAISVAGNVSSLIGGDQTMFLPAPRTWIEFIQPSGSRVAWLLEPAGDEDDTVISAILVCDDGESWGFCDRLFIDLKDGVLEGQANDWGFGWELGGFSPQNLIPVFLAFINTPRIVGRLQHMPNHALERRLTSRERSVGKFPVNAWTEIKLQISPPRDVSENGEHEAHLTGRKALHFCRSHLRIRLGRLEVVRSHWRGDASLGVRQSRYVLTH